MNKEFIIHLCVSDFNPVIIHMGKKVEWVTKYDSTDSFNQYIM